VKTLTKPESITEVTDLNVLTLYARSKSGSRRKFQNHFLKDIVHLFNVLHDFFGRPALQT
jgi:hypothetical protein